MAMRHVENELRRLGENNLANIIAAARFELRAKRDLDDFSFPEAPILIKMLQEFKTGFLIPELVTKTFQAIWNTRGEEAGIEIIVSPCDRTREELIALQSADRRIGYIPEQVMRSQDYPLLNKMFNCGNYYHSIDFEDLVTNKVDRSGWFDYEAKIDAPYIDTTNKQLREVIASEGERLKMNLSGMNVNEYIVASQDSKLFTGKYLDEYLDEGFTLSRLLGARLGGSRGGVVASQFRSDGLLGIDFDLYHRSPSSRLGGRSVGVKSVMI